MEMAHNSSHLSKYTQHNKAQPSKSFPLGAGFQQVILLYNAYFFQGGKFKNFICYLPFTPR